MAALLLSTDLPRSLETLAGLADLVRDLGQVYVRYSEGPACDDAPSVDSESGLPLPGLSANPLHCEDWWTRPLDDWLARQICQYRELQQKNGDRFAWILQGVEVGRGPDCEPLLRSVRPVGRPTDRLLAEAADRYRERFRAGKGPED